MDAGRVQLGEGRLWTQLQSGASSARQVSQARSDRANANNQAIQKFLCHGACRGGGTMLELALPRPSRSSAAAAAPTRRTGAVRGVLPRAPRIAAPARIRARQLRRQRSCLLGRAALVASGPAQRQLDQQPANQQGARPDNENEAAGRGGGGGRSSGQKGGGVRINLVGGVGAAQQLVEHNPAAGAKPHHPPPSPYTYFGSPHA